MTSLSPETYGVLEHILAGLASTDNATRSQAESTLNKTWITDGNVETLLAFLAQQAGFAADMTLRSLAAVLFRKIAIRAPPTVSAVITAKNIAHISPAALDQIRSILLQGFFGEQTAQHRHKLADAIAECAAESLSSWDQLLPALFEALQNQNPSFRDSAFRIFSTIPYLVNKISINEIIPVFQAGFTDGDDDVRIAACTAFVGYFQELPKAQWSKLGGLLPALLNSLPKFLDDGKDEALSSVLESLIELVELAPKMFRDMFDQMIQFVDIVIKNKDLDTNARTSALELLTVFSESAPNMCKNNSQYAHSVVMNTLVLMTEVSQDDDEASEWIESDDVDDDEEEVEYDHGRQALDRVALRLGGEVLAAPLFQLLPQMIASQQWRERQAALMALSSAVEGCREVLIGEIPRILDMVIPSINDPHPRVQYACCNALGQMSTDFASVIQRSAHDRVLPALISRLTTQSCARVQAHAAAALVNFSEHASQSSLEPYLDDLLTNLLTLLQSNKLFVQEQALTTIAFIAEAAKNKFIKYYDTLMPQLINVLKTDMGKENRVLKGKCMECATLMATAVGKDKFMPQSQEIVQLFAAYQQEGIEDDDALKPYLEQGWSRLCRILGSDFTPYLTLVIPPLLETAKATQDVSLIEEEEAASFQQYGDWDVVQIQGKHIAIHTAVLDDKVTAIDLLQSYAAVLKTQFAGYVAEIVSEIAVPSIDFYLHDGVRASAAAIMPTLLACLAGAEGSSQQVLALWHVMTKKLVHAITTEPLPEINQAYHTALADCIAIVGKNAMDESLLAEYATGVSSNLSDVFERVSGRENGDDEYNEDVDDEMEEYTDEDLMDEINKSLAAVLKSTGQPFLNHFQSLIPIINTFFQGNESTTVLFGLCTFGDLIEYTGDASAAFQQVYVPKLKEALVSGDARLRQAAAYAIGVAAQFAPQSYGQLCAECLPSLFQITAMDGAKHAANSMATENAIAAIAKILHAFGSGIPNSDAMIAQWVKTLPIIEDDECGPFAYRFLAQLIESQHPSVTGDVPFVFDAVVQALSHRTLAGKTAETVVASTKKLLGTYNDPMGLVSRYPEDVQALVQKWFS